MYLLQKIGKPNIISVLQDVLRHIIYLSFTKGRRTLTLRVENLRCPFIYKGRRCINVDNYTISVVLHSHHTKSIYITERCTSLAKSLHSIINMLEPQIKSSHCFKGISILSIPKILTIFLIFRLHASNRYNDRIYRSQSGICGHI